MYGALSLLYLQGLEELRGGEGGVVKSSYGGGKPQKGEPIFMVGVDPSKDHGNGLNIYIGYLMVYPQQKTCEMKTLTAQVTFIKDFTMNR